MKKLNVTLVSAVQTSFWGSSENEYQKKYIPLLEKLSIELEFNLTCIKEPACDAKTAFKLKNEIKASQPDFLLIQVSTFAAGDILPQLTECCQKIGIWGIDEVTDNGAIPNNSFCGMNMYASIIRQYQHNETPFKWFYGVDEELFHKRFEITIKALTALKNLNNSKVGLIGGIAPGFYDLEFDARTIKKKLGVNIERNYEYGDIKDMAIKYSEEELRNELQTFSQECGCISSSLSQSGIINTVRIYHAIKELISKEELNAVAISCWPKYRRDFGVVVCSVIGRLLENGIIAACEGDIESTISMQLLSYLTKNEIPMLMDFSKFDENDQTILCWHCGSAPKRYADKNGCNVCGHYKPGQYITGADEIKVAAVNDMYYAPNSITSVRFTDDCKRALVLSGEFIDKKDHSYDGSRGWIGNLKLNGNPISVRDFIETILSNGFQHHYPIIKGNCVNEIMETLAWLDIEPISPVNYHPYLQVPYSK